MILRSDKLEVNLYAVYLVALCGTFLSIFEDGNRLVNYSLLIPISVYFLVKGAGRLVAFLRNATVWILLFPVFVNILFKNFSINTVVQFYILITSMFVAYYLASEKEFFFILEAIKKGAWVVVPFVFVCLIVFPELVMMEFARGEGVSGIYGQKNAFGRYLVLCLAALCILQVYYRISVNNVCLVFLSFLLLFLTESRTALISGIVFFVALAFYLTGFYKYKYAFWGCGFLSCLWLFTYIEIDGGQIYIFGNEVNATGRIIIWEYFISKVAEVDPWFGLGFSSIYSLGEVLGFRDDLGWIVTDAHNAYIDLYSQLGALGGLIYISVYMYVVLVVYKSRFVSPEMVVFRSFVLICFVMYGVTSSYFLEPLSYMNHFLFMLFFVLTGDGVKGGCDVRRSQI